MQKLEISQDNVLKAYTAADNAQKSLLENLFGKENLQPKNIMDRVKTFDDALAIVGCEENEKILLNYNGLNKKIIAAQAFAKLAIICEALNEGWSPDYTNRNEYKWNPYWDMSGSGSGFSFCDSDYNCTLSDVGARLVFKSEKLSDYAAKQFFNLYKDMLAF